MTKPRRILFVVTKMDQGGAMALPLDVAGLLRARGHVAETWFLYKHQSAYEHEPHVHLVHPHALSGLLDYARLFLKLVPAMRRYRPDAVHGVLPLGNVFGLLSAALIGCGSRVASQHNPATTQSTPMRWLDLALGTLGVYTGNIAVSYAVRDSYGGYPSPYLRRLTVIQNGVPERPPKRLRAEARARFGLPQDAFVLGNVGRLAHQKNHDFLFDVLARLPDVHLVIAGEGELKESYAAAVRARNLEARVRLLGSIPGDEVPDFLQALDVFVLPSRYEGLPIALVEAMKAGLPIVASDIPPSREVLIDEAGTAAGVLLGIADAAPWVEALGRLAKDPAYLAGLAEAARRRGAFFSLERMVESYEAYLLGPLDETEAGAGRRPSMTSR